MNQQRVVALIYHVEHGPRVDYKSTASLVHEDDARFRVVIKGKEARFELREHHATENSARHVVDQYVRLWEFSAALTKGPKVFTLRFHKSEVVDLAPTTPGVVEITACSEHAIQGGGDITITHAKYPSPPSGIALSPNVQNMYERFMKYRENMEPLSSMAYFCVTVLEHEAHCLSGRSVDRSRRKLAAKTYGISKNVLDKIGELSTDKGGRAARKARGINVNLTDQEVRFLEDAIRRIILRAAEVEHARDGTGNKITLSDLPGL